MTAEVIGRRELTPLGIRVQVEADESWSSYMWRTSRVAGVSIASAARALGVHDRRTGRFPGWYTVRPSEEVRELWSADGDELDSMFLSRYEAFWSVVDAQSDVDAIARLEWLHVGASQVCPKCLAEGAGHWRIWWSLPFLAVCPIHQCLLSLRCPECGLKHGSGKRDGSNSPLFVQFPGDTRSCRNPANRGAAPELVQHLRPCGHDLTSLETPRIEDESVLSAQQHVFDVIHGRLTPRVAGLEVTPREWLRDLRTLMAWQMYAGSEDLAEGLPSSVQMAWSALCRERDAAIGERVGIKGSRDRAFTRTPSPAEVVVTAPRSVAILAEADPALFMARLAEVVDLTAPRRGRSRGSAVGRSQYNSAPFRVALHEATIVPGRVKAFLAGHPLRREGAAVGSAGGRIERAFAVGLPELATSERRGTLLPAFEFMVRFVQTPGAKDWSDVATDGFPATVSSKVLQLINRASDEGWATSLGNVVMSAALGVDPPVATGVQLVHRLATPVEWSATPEKAEPARDVSILAVALDPDRIAEATYTADDVPGTYWSDRMAGGLDDVLPESHEVPWLMRTALSVLLASYVSHGHVSEVSRRLGVPLDVFWPRIETGLQAFRAFPDRDRLEDLLEAEVAFLEASNGERAFGLQRARLEKVTELPIGDWGCIARRTGETFGNKGGARRFAAAYVWSKLTGGDPRLAPALTLNTDTATQDRESYARRFERPMSDDLRTGLDAYSEYLQAGGELGSLARTFVSRRSGSLGGLPGTAFEIGHVPTLLWNQTYQERFEHLLRPFGFKAVTARAALAVMLAEATVTAPRAWMAQQLGLPEQFGRVGVSNAIQKIRASTVAETVRRELNALAEELGRSVAKPNYQQRRAALEDFVDLSDEQWMIVRAGTKVQRGQPGGRTVHCAAWIWAHLTGSDARWSPAYNTLSGERNNVLTVYGSFARQTVPRLAGGLDRLEEQLAGDIDAKSCHAASGEDRHGDKHQALRRVEENCAVP